MSQKKPWAKIGIIVKAKEGDGQYMKFSDEITVLSGGEELEMTKSRSASIELVQDKGPYTLGVIKVKQTVIGEIRKGQEGKNNYIKFNPNVTFKVNSKVFSANKSNSATLKDPVQNVEQLIDKGLIPEDKIEQRRQNALNTASWLLYEVSMSPSDTTTK